MPSGLAAIILGEVTADGQCIEGTHLSPEAVDAIAAADQRAGVDPDRQRRRDLDLLRLLNRT